MKKFIIGLVLAPILVVANQINLEQIRRSVVFVATESNPFELSYGANPGYYEYFRPVYDYFWPSEHSHGSGFIISPDGYVITNAHVIEDSTKVLIVLRADELRICNARVLGKDIRTDLAVLKIEKDDEDSLPFVDLGDSSEVQVGDPVVCIGNPILDRLESTVTKGVISATDRNNFGDPIEGYLQTDAVLNNGNSGGPLFNSQGEVIGVCAWSLRRAKSEGLHFAIPSNVVKQIAKQIIAYGKISQGFLGVRLEEDRESAFDAYFFERNDGAWIKTIFKNHPADKAGLKAGDRIIGLNGQPVCSSKNFRNQLAILEAGTCVQLLVERQGKILEITVTLGDDEFSEQYSCLRGSSIVI